MTTTGLEYGRVARWTRPTTIYWLGVTSTSMVKIGLIQWGRAAPDELRPGTALSNDIGEKFETRLLFGTNGRGITYNVA